MMHYDEFKSDIAYWCWWQMSEKSKIWREFILANQQKKKPRPLSRLLRVFMCLEGKVTCNYSLETSFWFWGKQNPNLLHLTRLPRPGINKNYVLQRLTFFIIPYETSSIVFLSSASSPLNRCDFFRKDIFVLFPFFFLLTRKAGGSTYVGWRVEFWCGCLVQPFVFHAFWTRVHTWKSENTIPYWILHSINTGLAQKSINFRKYKLCITRKKKGTKLKFWRIIYWIWSIPWINIMM